MEGKYIKASDLPYGQDKVFDVPKIDVDSFRMYAYQSIGSKLVISHRRDLSLTPWSTEEAYICFSDVLYIFSNMGFFAGIRSFGTADYETTTALHVILQDNMIRKPRDESTQRIDFSQYRLFTSEIDGAQFQVYATAAFITGKNPVQWQHERR